MGGNALSQVGLETRRLQKDEYNEITAEILEKMCGLVDIALVPAYRNKESFGDADFVVSLRNAGDNLRTIIVDTLHPTHYVKNGNCYSFNVRDFQVDFILHPVDIFSTALNYYSWNDLGNLMGRIAHKMGYKYGHDGLTYEFKDGDYAFRDLFLSKNTSEVVRFLGFDPIRFAKGFDNIEDIFDFVATSSYFDPAIFLLENRNHKSRIRDKKRKTYMAFLDYCEKLDRSKKSFVWENPREHGGRRIVDWAMNKAFNTWPDFKSRYEQTERDYEDHLKFKELFNGLIVNNLTGLTDKELGAFMKHFLEAMGGKEEWKAAVLREPSNVENKVLQHFEKYKEEQRANL